MHELDPDINTIELKEELVKNLKVTVLKLNNDVDSYTEEELKDKFLVLYKEMEIPFDLIKDIDKNNSKITTYDSQLYMIILMLYSTLYGMLFEIIYTSRERLENIQYEVIRGKRGIEYFVNKNFEMYFKDNDFFIKANNAKQYKLKLKDTFSPDELESILTIFKKKRNVQLHPVGDSVTVEFCQNKIDKIFN